MLFGGGVGTFRRGRFARRSPSLGIGWSLSLDTLASLLFLGFQVWMKYELSADLRLLLPRGVPVGTC